MLSACQLKIERFIGKNYKALMPKELKVVYFLLTSLFLQQALGSHRTGVYSLQSKSGMLPVYVNQALLEHSHVHSFT